MCMTGLTIASASRAAKACHGSVCCIMQARPVEQLSRANHLFTVKEMPLCNFDHYPSSQCARIQAFNFVQPTCSCHNVSSLRSAWPCLPLSSRTCCWHLSAAAWASTAAAAADAASCAACLSCSESSAYTPSRWQREAKALRTDSKQKQSAREAKGSSHSCKLYAVLGCPDSESAPTQWG